jgi:glucokinase
MHSAAGVNILLLLRFATTVLVVEGGHTGFNKLPASEFCIVFHFELNIDRLHVERVRGYDGLNK